MREYAQGKWDRGERCALHPRPGSTTRPAAASRVDDGGLRCSAQANKEHRLRKSRSEWSGVRNLLAALNLGEGKGSAIVASLSRHVHLSDVVLSDIGGMRAAVNDTQILEMRAGTVKQRRRLDCSDQITWATAARGHIVSSTCLQPSSPFTRVSASARLAGAAIIYFSFFLWRIP